MVTIRPFVLGPPQTMWLVAVVKQNRTVRHLHTCTCRGRAGTKIKDEYVYIDIGIDGKTHLALLDTGCQLSLIHPSLVGSRPLQPSVDHLFAANSSPIHILGTVELPVNIGGHDLVIKMLVTPDVREPMLSFAWLKENLVCWDFTRNALYVHGR